MGNQISVQAMQAAWAQSLGTKNTNHWWHRSQQHSTTNHPKSSPLHIDFNTQKNWGSPCGFAQTLWLGLQETKCKSPISPNPTSSCPFGSIGPIPEFFNSSPRGIVWVGGGSCFQLYFTDSSIPSQVCTPSFQGLWCADTAHFRPLWHPTPLQRQPNKEIKGQSTSKASPTRQFFWRGNKHHAVSFSFPGFPGA